MLTALRLGLLSLIVAALTIGGSVEAKPRKRLVKPKPGWFKGIVAKKRFPKLKLKLPTNPMRSAKRGSSLRRTKKLGRVFRLGELRRRLKTSGKRRSRPPAVFTSKPRKLGGASSKPARKPARLRRPAKRRPKAPPRKRGFRFKRKRR